ncbi:hypothetical protein HPB49_003555 [Dermacentor silvarum]|uniref:Uncharacterized protein n=1 Tax=Dermacentor silvarum TaxID=543639 RepID=A0ACB8CD58_DERSI|nr:hypothetical protein HPB49_003555 [Dermacentor silvarum]
MAIIFTEKNAALSLSGVGPSARRNAAPARAGRARIGDNDASAMIGATTPIEKNSQREDNATDLSQKRTLDNGGWFTAKYHNSRLFAVSETGTEAKLPPLPNTDFIVIIRPKNGLNISRLSTHQTGPAITKARGNPDMCDEGNLLIRLRNGSNIAIISTPIMETANVVQSVPSVRFGAKDCTVTAYVAAPDNSCKGVIHGLDAGTTPTELIASLRGKIVPRYVYYYGSETRCYLYRSSRQVCYICFKPGNRADVCPTPDAVVCSNFAEPVSPHLRAQVCAMQGSAPHTGKGVQGTPQETEEPTGEKIRGTRRRSQGRWRTWPGQETLLQ